MALVVMVFLGACAGGLSPRGGDAPAPAVQAQREEPTARQRLAGELDRILADERFQDAFWGVHVESVDTGEVYYTLNADRLFLPASNQKVLTAAAALNYLGPEFRFETFLTANGAIEGGTLAGDLVVFGNGDPTLHERFHGDARDLFRSWAGELSRRGITRIAGNIIGDDNAWDDTHTGYGWPLDGLVNWYWAEFGPLQLNENSVNLTIFPPPDPGGGVTVSPNPPSAYYTLENRLKAVGRGETRVSMERDVRSNIIILEGEVRAGDAPFRRTATITNPTAYYVTVLRETLQEEGIAVEGTALDCDDLPGWDHRPDDFELIATHRSPPLADILSVLYKRSQNLYAETLVSTMGWKRNGRGTVGGGRAVVVEEMARLGVGADQFLFRDGSGLSRYNYVTPRALVTVCREMLRGPHAATWWEIQSLAGVDGTLTSRLAGTEGERNVRAKTGTISAVRALTGYITTGEGELLAFSIIVNSHRRPAREADEVIDAMLLALAEHGAPKLGE